MLVDRGKIADDPVSKYIPSFAGMKVGVEERRSGRPALDLVPLRRPVSAVCCFPPASLQLHGEGMKAAYDGIYLGNFDNTGSQKGLRSCR